jgi:hypothetical protein
LNRFQIDIFRGILYILIGFTVGYVAWLFGAQTLFIGSSVRQTLNGIFFLSLLSPLILYFLWYWKIYKYRKPVERTDFIRNYQLLTLLSLGINIAILSVILIYYKVFFDVFLYASIISVSLAVALGFSFKYSIWSEEIEFKKE